MRRNPTNDPILSIIVSDRDIDAVSSMFPNVNRLDIARDLATTRSIQVTCDNILNGRITITTTATPQSQTQTQSGTTALTAQNKSSAVLAYIPNVKLDAKDAPKVWCGDPVSRQQVLLKRKQFMMQQARMYVTFASLYASDVSKADFTNSKSATSFEVPFHM